MVLDRALFKHVEITPHKRLRERGREKEREGRGGEGRGEASLSQHHHAAVPRNPSSKRDTASLNPWLRLAGWWGDARDDGQHRVTRDDPRLHILK